MTPPNAFFLGCKTVFVFVDLFLLDFLLVILTFKSRADCQNLDLIFTFYLYIILTAPRIRSTINCSQWPFLLIVI